MQLRLAKALVGLLAFSPLFRPTQAYPYAGTDAALSEESTSTQTAADSLYVSLVDTITSTHTKRAVPIPLRMVHPAAGLEITWSGIVKEPMNSGWTRQTIQAYAKEGWEQTQAETPRQITLVSALWIPRRGVYLGSIPHAIARADKEHVEIAFETTAGNSAPLLWNEIGCRVMNEGATAMYHAEDMAMATYERAENPKTQYPAGAYMATYGQYSSNDTPGLKPPCGLTSAQQPTRNPRIVPTCASVLQNLGISH